MPLRGLWGVKGVSHKGVFLLKRQLGNLLTKVYRTTYREKTVGQTVKLGVRESPKTFGVQGGRREGAATLLVYKTKSRSLHSSVRFDYLTG